MVTNMNLELEVSKHKSKSIKEHLNNNSSNIIAAHASVESKEKCYIIFVALAIGSCYVH